MRALLDTHVFLWLQASPDRLSAATLDLLADRRNALLLSAVSSLEIGVKYSVGRLPLPLPPSEFVIDGMRRSRLEGLPIEHADALAVAELPLHHRDPFDRLLVAQALLHRIPLLTSDPAFEAYDIETLPAG